MHSCEFTCAYVNVTLEEEKFQERDRRFLSCFIGFGFYTHFIVNSKGGIPRVNYHL